MPEQHPSPKPSLPTVAPSSTKRKLKFVLDSHAILALLENEKGQERVANLLEASQNNEIQLFLSLINWGEVLYILERERGAEVISELETELDEMPIILMPVDRTRIRAAARIKSAYPVSYGDAFVIALAQELEATVVTGDPEFKKVEKAIDVLWLER